MLISIQGINLAFLAFLAFVGLFLCPGPTSIDGEFSHAMYNASSSLHLSVTYTNEIEKSLGLHVARSESYIPLCVFSRTTESWNFPSFLTLFCVAGAFDFIPSIPLVTTHVELYAVHVPFLSESTVPLNYGCCKAI